VHLSGSFVSTGRGCGGGAMEGLEELGGAVGQRGGREGQVVVLCCCMATKAQSVLSASCWPDMD
jgi:hypothetical protein